MNGCVLVEGCYCGLGLHMFSSFLIDCGYVESSDMSTADSDSGGSGTESDSTYFPTPKRRVGKRVGAVQQTAGSTGMLVHVPVLQPVNPPAGTEPCVCTRQPESAEGVVSAFESSPIAIPNQVGFMKVSQIGVFVEAINKIRGCRTPTCNGKLVPVAVKSTGLGGGLSVCFGCDGCKSKLALFESFTRYEQGAAHKNDTQCTLGYGGSY